MTKAILIPIGCVATLLAILGAILPGLPTTPFLLVALWAFARSSERLHGWLVRIPMLRGALAEAKRFEERRAVRPGVKIFAVSMAWASVLLTALATGGERPVLLASVAAAAVAGTAFMAWVATDRG